jgi:membrane protease YdiL (CAAX protease family)
MIIRFLMGASSAGIKNDLILPSAGDTILVIILAFTLFPISTFTGRLNSEMNLPQWLSGVEIWISEKEDSIGQIFDILMKQETAGIMVLNLFTIAILPALGEEFIFRGVMQKILSAVFRNKHFAVWITALLFSAVHLQFYGFLPRLILGLTFGYLYLWSGSIWLPVIAHFVNNAVPTVGAYVYGWESYNQSAGALTGKDLFGLILPVTISIVILALIRLRGIAVNSTSRGNIDLPSK